MHSITKPVCSVRSLLRDSGTDRMNPAEFPQDFKMVIKSEYGRSAIEGNRQPVFESEMSRRVCLSEGDDKQMNYMTGVYWERGNTAKGNQDSLVLLQVLTGRGRLLMAAVCDGMGGLSQGETASGYVTKRLQEWFYESLIRSVKKRKPYWVIRRSLDRLAYHMQEQLLQYSKQGRSPLGTTMTVLVLYEKTYLIWHLGDSRAYKLQDVSGRKRCRKGMNGAVCLTQDHVKGKNMLTKCVGSFGYDRPDFAMGEVRSGQAMLLCSDGFRNHIVEQELVDVLEPRKIKEEEQAGRRLHEIGEACMKRGERDNMSAVYIKVMV